MWRIGDFGKSILTLGVGTSIAQAISLIFYPILGRLYSPDEFGLLATITVISSVVMVISTGKYEQAILITKSKLEAANVLGLSILLATIICGIMILIFALFSSLISSWLNAPDLSYWIKFSPLISLSIIVYNCYNEWCVKYGIFAQLSINKIVNSISVTLAKIMLGVWGVGGGLIVGEVLGRGISASLCTKSILKRNYLFFRESISKKGIILVARNYKDFPFYTMPDQLVSCLSGFFPMFFLLKYFGTTEYGYFAMVQLVLSFPATLIGQSVMDAFRKQASADYEETGQCNFIFKKVFRVIACLTGIGFFPVYYCLPIVFSFFLGNQWIIAGSYAQIILPAIALGFVYNIFSAIWIIAEKQKARFMWQIYYCFTLFLAIGIGGFLLNNIKQVLVLYTVALSSSYLIGIWFMCMYSQKRNVCCK